MNTEQERRVVEALQALTGGLTVTEHDILTANNRLRDNLEPPSPRRKLTLAVAAAAAIAVVGFVAFQGVDDEKDDANSGVTTGVPSAAERLTEELQGNAYGQLSDEFVGDVTPTQADFTGLWLLRDPFDGILFVDADGDWGHYEAPSGMIGKATLDGRTWTRHVLGQHCGGVQEIPFTAGLAGDGSLHLLFSGSVNACTPAENREVWDRLLPGPSPVMDYFRDSTEDLAWDKPTASWDWEGQFVDPVTGSLLTIAADGSYQYFEDVTGTDVTPADQGRIDQSTDHDTLAASCADGSFEVRFQVGQVPAVDGLLASYRAARISSAGETCGAGLGGEHVWVRLWQ